MPGVLVLLSAVWHTCHLPSRKILYIIGLNLDAIILSGPSEKVNLFECSMFDVVFMALTCCGLA